MMKFHIRRNVNLLLTSGFVCSIVILDSHEKQNYYFFGLKNVLVTTIRIIERILVELNTFKS